MRESTRESTSVMRESPRESTSVMGVVTSALWETSAVGEREADATGWEFETTWERAAGMRATGVGVSFGWRSEDGCGCHCGDEEGE